MNEGFDLWDTLAMTFGKEMTELCRKMAEA